MWYSHTEECTGMHVASQSNFRQLRIAAYLCMFYFGNSITSFLHCHSSIMRSLWRYGLYLDLGYITPLRWNQTDFPWSSCDKFTLADRHIVSLQITDRQHLMGMYTSHWCQQQLLMFGCSTRVTIHCNQQEASNSESHIWKSACSCSSMSQYPVIFVCHSLW